MGRASSSRPSSPRCPSRRTASSGRPRPRSALRSTRSRTAYRAALACPRAGCMLSFAAAQSPACRISLRAPGGVCPRLVPLSLPSLPRAVAQPRQRQQCALLAASQNDYPSSPPLRLRRSQLRPRARRSDLLGCGRTASAVGVHQAIAARGQRARSPVV
ncbi:hypothetical protein BD311DRAFT_762022 [Dichomitus squalens]|uniref:Uncharacterized protein n=1 Tax=Dichomitus squalens TaxID=114155 RepID=A0A4Q9MJ41_9APHY|nr:hypothetical protein BD311DRAFT_762022 [Dichomitus squalens]